MAQVPRSQEGAECGSRSRQMIIRIVVAKTLAGLKAAKIVFKKLFAVMPARHYRHGVLWNLFQKLFDF
jgi:hypothetical protein